MRRALLVASLPAFLAAGCRPSNAWTQATLQVRRVLPRDASEPWQFIVDVKILDHQGGILQEPTLTMLEDQEGTILVGGPSETKDDWSALRPGRPVDAHLIHVRCRDLSDGTIELKLEIQEKRDGAVLSSNRLTRFLADRQMVTIDR